MHLKKREGKRPAGRRGGSPAPPGAAQSKLPDEAAAQVRDLSRDALPLRSARQAYSQGCGRAPWVSRPIFSEKGATTLNGVCHASLPLFHPGVSRGAAPSAPGAGKTSPFQLALPAAATLDPHSDRTRARVCARVCARARARAPGCVPARPGHGARVLSGTTLPGCLQLGEFSFKPAPRPGHPPRPTGGDDVRSLVARQAPGRRRRSLTGAGAQTSAAGPLARLLGRRRLPPPHLPARPWGGGQRNRRRGEGAGRR